MSEKANKQQVQTATRSPRKQQHRTTDTEIHQPDSGQLDYDNLSQETVHYLQSTIGNAAIQRMMADGGTVRQQGMGRLVQGRSSPAKIQRENQDGEAVRADQSENIANLTDFKTNFDDAFKLTNAYATKSADVGKAMKDKLAPIAERYAEAYQIVRDILTQAEQEAQDQQYWMSFVVGVAAGAAASVIAASTPFGAPLATLLATVGQQTAIAAVGTTGAAGIMEFAEVEGQSIDSTGIDPSIQQLELWQKIASIYESGHSFNNASLKLHDATVKIAELLGNVQLYQAGTDSDLDDSQINSIISQISSGNSQLSEVMDELTAKNQELDQLKAVIDEVDASSYTVNQMEKDLWTMWIASLGLDSNILDLDAIEDHLGPEGLGMVDFGIYTSDADENQAILEARVRAATLQEQYNNLYNPETIAEARDQAESTNGPVYIIEPNMSIAPEEANASYDPSASEGGVCYDPNMEPEGGFRQVTPDDDATYFMPSPSEQNMSLPGDESVGGWADESDEENMSIMLDEPNQSIFNPEDEYRY